MADSSTDNRLGSLKASFEQLKAKVMPFLGKTQNSRQIAVIALLSAVMAVAVVTILWSSSTSFVPLYGSQEGYDKASIIDVLDAQSVDYKIDADTGNVLVPKSKVASARMSLASEGVTPEMPEGMESLKELSGLSTSKFMETNHYTNAVQGELSKTIMTINGVRGARVHLALPERKVFVGRTEIKPTASVVLDLANPLKPAQVEAIVSLVAGSIPDLEDASVSVVDQKGELLTAALSGSSPGRVSTQQMQYVAQMENRISQRAGDMLEPVIGGHNFRIRVAADVDFSEVEETRETLDNTPVMLSENGVEDSLVDSMAAGVPGALSNQPPVPGDEADMVEESDMLNKREEYNRRFETGRSVTHTKRGESRLSKMSVSVVLNGNAAPEGGWSDEQVEDFRELVQTAAGIDEERGDSLTLQVAPFANAAEPEVSEGKSWIAVVYEFEGLIRNALGLIMFILLLVFGVRPLVKKVTEDKEKAAASDEDEDEEAKASNKKAFEAKQYDIDLPPPGSEFVTQMNHLRMLVEKQPGRTADIISNLINNSESSDNEQS